MSTDPTPSIDESLSAYIASYTSKFLSSEQARCWLPRLRELVAAVPPVDEHDARGMLTAGCRYMVDTADGTEPTAGVDDVLTRELLGRWSYRALADGRAHQTTRHYTARLQRLVRVRDGLPGRLKGKASTRNSYAPLAFDELDELLEACRARGPEVASVLVAAFGAGMTEGSAVGGRIGRTMSDGWVFVAADGVPHPIVTALWPYAADVAGVVVPEWTWKRARRCADRVGVTLSWARARQTFRFLALTSDLPVGLILAHYRLTKEALDQIQRFLPAIDPASSAQLLRAAIALPPPLGTVPG